MLQSTPPVKLFCLQVATRIVFRVEVDSLDAFVEDLKVAIKTKLASTIPTSCIDLYITTKHDGGKTEWLSDADVDMVQLQRPRLSPDVERRYLNDEQSMEPSDVLGDYMTESALTNKSGVIHVLVDTRLKQQWSVDFMGGVLASKTQARAVWVVDGTIENALSTRGIRGRLYQLAEACRGVYDPVSHTESGANGFWCDEQGVLHVHVLFKRESDAEDFETALLNQPPTIGSTVHINKIVQSTRLDSELERRIHTIDYVAEEDTESPHHGDSVSQPDHTPVIGITTDEFRYQRIEKESCFGRHGKAESCKLMPRAHCLLHESFRQYDDDPSNRLALSRDLHGFYDALNTTVPMFNIYAESVSPSPGPDARYKVRLRVCAFDCEYGKLIANRMKEDTIVSEDYLEMRTSVRVLDPTVFCVCLQWKSEQIDMEWEDYLDMTPAVD